MQVSFTRRLARGLGGNINYTWSRGLSSSEPDSGGVTGVTAYCAKSGCIEDMGGGTTKTITNFLSYNWGNSSLDIRQRISGMMSYTLPFAKNAHGVLATAAEDWNVNLAGYWETGQNAQVQYCCGVNVTGINGGMSIPNLVGNPKGKQTLNSWFNADAFAIPTPGTYGNAGINTLYGPHLRHADLSASKAFPLKGEGDKLEFRAEAFNVTNTANFLFNSQSTGLGNSQAGTITNTIQNYNPRLVQFVLRLSF
jgi:hypothetical protein